MISGQYATTLGWVERLHLLRSRWPLILLLTSLVLLAGAALRTKTTRLYEATARIELDPAPEAAVGLAGTKFRPEPPGEISRQAAELGSRALLSETAEFRNLAERWGADDDEALSGLLQTRLRVVAIPEEHALAVIARDLSKEKAAALANALAGRFVARKESEARAEANARLRRLEAEAAACQREIEGMEGRLVEIEHILENDGKESADLRQRLANQRHLLHSFEAKRQLAVLESKEAKAAARIAAPALPGRAAPVVPLGLSLPVLLLLGLAIGVAAALASHRERSRWSAVAELMEGLQAPFAGFAPLSGRSQVPVKDAPAPLLEPYRELRNRLLRLPAGGCLILTLMPYRRTDPLGEAVVNLACVLADAGRTTLVIDADFRQPTLHGFFDAARHPGLSDFLSGEMRLEETVVRSRRPNLWFMPAGPLHDDPGGLLNGRRMGDLVWELRSRFEFILIASPSIHEVSDAGLLAGLADYTAVVTPCAGHSLRQLRETKTALETVSAPLGGVILTTRVQGVGKGYDGWKRDSAAVAQR